MPNSVGLVWHVSYGGYLRFLNVHISAVFRAKGLKFGNFLIAPKYFYRMHVCYNKYDSNKGYREAILYFQMTLFQLFQELQVSNK